MKELYITSDMKDSTQPKFENQLIQADFIIGKLIAALGCTITKLNNSDVIEAAICNNAIQEAMIYLVNDV